MENRRGNEDRVIDVELLALNLTACGPCGGTLANVEKAIGIVRPALAATGIDLRLKTIVVESEEEARRHQFAVSPTIRVDGRDLTQETLEGHCGDCTELSGARGGTLCRVWSYRGERHSEVPVGLVVEALLAEIGRGSETSPAEPAKAGWEVPENLRRFFAGRAARASGQGPEHGTSESAHAGCGCG